MCKFFKVCICEDNSHTGTSNDSQNISTPFDFTDNTSILQSDLSSPTEDEIKVLDSKLFEQIWPFDCLPQTMPPPPPIHDYDNINACSTVPSFSIPAMPNSRLPRTNASEHVGEKRKFDMIVSDTQDGRARIVGEMTADIESTDFLDVFVERLDSIKEVAEQIRRIPQLMQLHKNDRFEKCVQDIKNLGKQLQASVHLVAKSTKSRVSRRNLNACEQSETSESSDESTDDNSDDERPPKRAKPFDPSENDAPSKNCNLKQKLRR